MLFSGIHVSWQEVEAVIFIFIFTALSRALRTCKGNYTPCTKAVEAIIGRFRFFGSSTVTTPPLGYRQEKVIVG